MHYMIHNSRVIKGSAIYIFPPLHWYTPFPSCEGLWNSPKNILWMCVQVCTFSPCFTDKGMPQDRCFTP